jgi:hypothetical protein
MGLINLDNYVCSNGVQKTGTYISFANETLYMRQGPLDANGLPTYTVNANYRIFWDQASREAGLTFIDLKSVNACVSKDMLTSNMYGCLYDALKQIYPNTADELKAAPDAPVPVPVPVVPDAPVPVPVPNVVVDPFAPATNP